MANLIHIEENQLINAPSINLMPAFAMFNDSFTWNVVSGIATATNINQYQIEGDGCLRIVPDSTAGAVVNTGGSQMQVTIDFDGNYIFSIKHNCEMPASTLMNAIVKIYVNGTPTDYSFTADADNNGQYRTYYQNIPNLLVGDVVDFAFEFDPNGIGGAFKHYYDAPKFELDNFGLGLPTAFSLPQSLLNATDVIGLGWASYVDTIYTVGSPFAIIEGVTSTLPNNSGTVIDDYLPTGITAFYDQATQKITPENIGDFYSFTIRFKAKNSNIAGYFDFGIDIGGAIGTIFPETQLFLKGANTEQAFNIVCNGYSLNTFIANGGTIKIHAILGNLSIYDISYQINRTFKA